MTHHKRKRPRNRRAGCKMCKPWKINGVGKNTPIFESFSDFKRRQAKIDEQEEYENTVKHAKERLLTMGRFDYVKYEADCMGCGEKLNTFQSKSAGCYMEVLEPWQVTEMHTNCPKCNTWNAYDICAEVEHVVKKIKITLNKKKSGPID